jgi:hypothetical protein
MKLDLNLIVSALKKTILVGASTHLIILALFAWKMGDIDMLNIYNILDFDLIKPTLGHGTENFLCSWVFITAIFALMLVVSNQKKSKHSKN